MRRKTTPASHTTAFRIFTASGGWTRAAGRNCTGCLPAPGLGDVEFQYPFPDYKLPSWVLTQQAFETEAFDPCAILRGVDSTHNGRKVALAADERKIRSVLHRNGLLDKLANSFLVVAGASAQVPALWPGGLLASGYVTDRMPWFNTRTRMILKDGGEIVVEKSRLSAALPPQPCELANVAGAEPYRKGPQLECVIVESLQQRGLDAGLAVLRRWIDHLIQFGLADEDKSDIYASTLRPEFFDCAPPNLIVQGDALHQIDLEWRYRGALPLRTHVLRYLRQFEREQKLLGKLLPGRAPLALQLARRLGIAVSKPQYRQARQWMAHAQPLDRAGLCPKPTCPST